MKIVVETDDLVTVADIARRLKMNRSTVSMWIARRATTGFPAPRIETPSVRLWSWAAVRAWLPSEEES